jgi:hypothetical protein
MPSLRTTSPAQSAAEGKVFSPQNWLKGKSSVSDEQLVAGTIVSVCKTWWPVSSPQASQA